jgi:hypothetical protein
VSVLRSAPMARRVNLLIGTVLAALLVACGGGDTGVRIVRASPTPGATVVADASATATSTAAPVPLPPRPDNPFAGGLAVAAYLAGGKADLKNCLPDLVAAWDLSPVDGQRCVSADIDGDGQDEFIFLVTIKGDPLPAGEVWFFDDVKTHYRFFSSARALANDVLTGVAIAGVADLTGDGKREIAWNGIGFVLHDTPGDPVYLINLVDNADAAFKAGDLAKARALYEQAATDTTLKDWKAETNTFVGRRELVPYAYFREALVAQRQGDAAAVKDLLTKASANHQNSMHGIAAATYLAALTAGQTPAQACSAAKQYLSQFQSAYAQFWDYGYANPEHTIADLC